MIFIVSWATVFQDVMQPIEAGGIGKVALWAMVAFIFVLEVGHFYVWKQGALTWAPLGRRQVPRSATVDPAVDPAGPRAGAAPPLTEGHAS